MPSNAPSQSRSTSRKQTSPIHRTNNIPHQKEPQVTGSKFRHINLVIMTWTGYILYHHKIK
jgi:hypothetical protein